MNFNAASLKGAVDFLEAAAAATLAAAGAGVERKCARGETSGARVGRAGDGGIDGVISLDRLGLEKVYVQAKRWQGSVGRPDVQAFYGALAGQRANRGVFITTSTFTKDALEFVEAMPQKIVLIDGRQLASLMIEHDVGVSPTKAYTLKRLDQDYFENL